MTRLSTEAQYFEEQKARNNIQAAAVFEIEPLEDQEPEPEQEQDRYREKVLADVLAGDPF